MFSGSRFSGLEVSQDCSGDTLCSKVVSLEDTAIRGAGFKLYTAPAQLLHNSYTLRAVSPSPRSIKTTVRLVEIVQIVMSEVNQVEAKTYSSSATVATKTKISPSNIGGQDGAKMEGPRCQVLKLLHGAVAVEPIVVKSLPHRLHECEEMENSVKRCSNLEKLVITTAYVPRLMGRFLINLEQRKLNLKKQRRLRCSETQNILSPQMKKFPFSFSSKKKETSKSIEEPRENIETETKSDGQT